MKMKTSLTALSLAVLAAALSGCFRSPADSENRIIEETAQAEIREIIEVTTAADEPEEEAAQTETHSGETAQAEPSQDQDPSISLLFGGDVLLSDHVLNAYETAGGIGGVLDSGYLQLIDENDFFIVNQEFPFSDRGTQAPDKQFTFRLPPERVSMFQEMGIDAVTLANNHALDFGTDALLDTVSVLDEAGILHTGAGSDLKEASQPVLLTAKDRTIAVIGATRVIPVADWAAGNSHPGMLATYDPAVLLEEIRQLDEQYDHVIVFVHWGIERDELPQEYQRSLGQQYIDAGADLVVGSHPHVLQGIEYYNGKPIVYSLGNFVFGSSIPRTALLQAEIWDDGTVRLKLFPGTSGAGYTRMITDESQLQEALDHIRSISFGADILPDGTVVFAQQ